MTNEKVEFEARHLLKEPLGLAELRALAKKAGGAERLVAPKRRKEAEGLAGDALLEWMSEEPGRVRRPLIDVDGELVVGFAADAQDQLRELLAKKR